MNTPENPAQAAPSFRVARHLCDLIDDARAGRLKLADGVALPSGRKIEDVNAATLRMLGIIRANVEDLEFIHRVQATQTAQREGR